jgi:DNA-binding winged helix-turn-helix (wHTH) protein/TolB-like protein/Tfp pilus assembly protein PilF
MMSNKTDQLSQFKTTQAFRFGDYELDVAERVLRRDGEIVSLPLKPIEVLLVLLERRGRVVSKEELIEQVWPDSYVDEANLARHIYTLRRALGGSPRENGEDHFIQTVSGRGYRFIAEVKIGDEAPPDIEQSIVSVSQAAVSPQPVSAIIPAQESVGHERPREARIGFRPIGSTRIVPAIILMLVSIAAALAVSHFRMSGKTERPATERRRTIAVLPFKPLSASDRDEAFELGMADALITKLGGLSQLIVRPTGAIRKYSSLDQDPIAAGREQQVEAVLEGSLHREGEKVRVTARLLNTSDGSSIWSDHYDEIFSDIFTAQDSISEKIARALAPELTGAEQLRLTRRHTNNTEAYQLYYKGRYHLFRRTEPDAQKAIAYFRQSVKLDPQYALAYEGLAYAYASLSYLTALAPKETMPKAKESVTEALKIDELLAEAHATSGQFKFSYDWDWSGAERELKHALDLNPNSADVRQAYAFYLLSIGRSKEAIAEVNEALELDPASLFLNKNLGQFLYLSRDYDRAIEQLQKTLDLDPNFVTAYQWIGESYEQKGAYEQTIDWDMKAISPEKTKALKDAYAASGWRGYWRKRIDLAREDAKHGYSEPYLLATIHARLGEKEQAFACLDKAYEGRSHWLIYLKVDPKLDPLRSDPRFADLERRIGLSH